MRAAAKEQFKEKPKPQGSGTDQPPTVVTVAATPKPKDKRATKVKPGKFKKVIDAALKCVGLLGFVFSLISIRMSYLGLDITRQTNQSSLTISALDYMAEPKIGHPQFLMVMTNSGHVDADFTIQYGAKVITASDPRATPVDMSKAIFKGRIPHDAPQKFTCVLDWLSDDDIKPVLAQQAVIANQKLLLIKGTITYGDAIAGSRTEPFERVFGYHYGILGTAIPNEIIRK